MQSLSQVRATDPDVDRKSRIRYGLTGQFVDDGTFMINEHTGEITLTRSLDRDYPRGRPIWNFNVLAHDESDNFQQSLTGYAEVRIIPRDVNDNAPVFDRNRLIGRVPEHSRAGYAPMKTLLTYLLPYNRLPAFNVSSVISAVCFPEIFILLIV